MLYGRSDPEALVPYQPFITALAHFVAHREHLVLPREVAAELSELARFVPDLRRHVPELRETLSDDPETRRFRLFEGVNRLLAYAARERPVVLLLDDLHWADASTTLLLGHLLQDARADAAAGRRHRPDVRGRAAEPPAPPAELRADRALRADRGGDARARRPRDVSSGFLRRLTDETSGNPFFIEETLRSLPALEERALSQLAVPEGVKEMISRRLQQLSDPANQVLNVAAVIGRRFDLAMLEALVDDDRAGRGRRGDCRPDWSVKRTN